MLFIETDVRVENDILTEVMINNVLNNVFDILKKDKYNVINDKKIDLNKDLSLSVVITDDDEIKALNKEYRGIDAPTDVLSFAFQDDDVIPNADNVVLGDIVISYPYLKKSAAENKVEETEEAKRLLIHSMLHLLGFNHDTPNFDKEPMLILQEQILEELG